MRVAWVVDPALLQRGQVPPRDPTGRGRGGPSWHQGACWWEGAGEGACRESARGQSAAMHGSVGGMGEVGVGSERLRRRHGAREKASGDFAGSKKARTGRDDADGGEGCSGAGSWATNGGGSGGGSGLPSGVRSVFARAVRRQRQREQAPRPDGECRGAGQDGPAERRGPAFINSDCSGMAGQARVDPKGTPAGKDVSDGDDGNIGYAFDTHACTRAGTHKHARSAHTQHVRARAHTHTHTHTHKQICLYKRPFENLGRKWSDNRAKKLCRKAAQRRRLWCRTPAQDPQRAMARISRRPALSTRRESLMIMGDDAMTMFVTVFTRE